MRGVASLTPYHFQLARSVVRSMGLGVTPTEDLQQEALIAAWGCPEGSEAWTVGCAMRNAAIDLVRHEGHTRNDLGNIMVPLGDHDAPDPCDGPECILLQRQRARLALRAIGELQGRQAEVIRLHYGLEMSLTEIAQEWGVALSQVSRVHAATIRALQIKAGRIPYADQ